MRLALPVADGSKPACQQQNNKNNHEDANSSAWCIAPMAAMGPGGKNAHKCQNQYHQKNGSEVHDVLLINQALMMMEKMIGLRTQADSEGKINAALSGF
jgi:hypothetical protein